jgi:hypothetical protein
MKTLSSRNVLLAAATLVAASSAHAAAQTWTIAGATNDWNATDLNWAGAAWVNTGANDAIFGNNAVTAGETVTLGQSISANGLTVSNSNATGYSFNIGSGIDLNVNGNVTVGANLATYSTAATFAGLGSFTVGDGITNRNFQVGGASGTTAGNSVTLDMGGISNFTANLGSGGLFRLGDMGGSANAFTSTVTLAKTSTITAGTLDLGGSSPHGGLNTLKLGDTSNTINATTIYLGTDTAAGRGSGAISFATGTGTLQIRDTAGTGRANMSVASTTNGTGIVITGLFDTTGHSANLLLGTLGIGNRDLGTASTTVLSTAGTFSFNAGTLDVTTIKMGARSNVNNANNVTADLNLGGGTVTIGNFSAMGRNNNTSNTGTSTSTLNISGGTVGIGSILNMAVNGASNGVVTSTVNITGGTVTLGGDITRNSGSLSNATATLTLDGGTLDMGGHNIGGVGGAALTNVNLRSGTLKNLVQLNNGGVLTKTTAGTLTLKGVNTYTGGTTISAGTLVTGSTGALSSGAVAISGGALQVGDGTVNTVTGVGAITLNSGALKFVGIGASITQAGTNGFLLTNGFTLDLNNAFNAVGTYELITSAGTSNSIGTYTLSGANTGAYAFDFTLSGNNALLTVTAVPEPSEYGLIGAGALAAVAFVRRRRKLAGKAA